MKAVIITHPGGPEVLQVAERPVPHASGNEVIIKVMAAGINRPDVFQRKGNYPPPPGVISDVPGLEVAGVVVQCGTAVTRWHSGDKVCALLAGGGYAEYAQVNADHCLPWPSDYSAAQAAALPETVFTVWHNVFRRGNLQPGEHLLVHGGSGGIGSTAIQLAKAFGAKVTATAGSAEKCKACTSLGAYRCINYHTEDFEAVLKEEGVDVVLDMVGGDYVAKNLRLLRPDGRLVFINAIKGAKSEIDVHDLMRRRLTITGSTLRSRDARFKAGLAADVETHVWPLFKEGKFTPVIHRQFALQGAAEAHRLMESGEHIGKLVLVNEEG